jgi:hypothetical protein
MNELELFLSVDLLSCADRRGNEYAWRRKDLLRVAGAAEMAGLASSGVQVQFRSLDGTFGITWRSFEPGERRAHESWIEYINRSWKETCLRWQNLFDDEELIEEGRKIFKIIKETESQAVLPSDVLWFVLNFVPKPADNETCICKDLSCTL